MPEKRDRRKVWLAVLASLLLHVVIALSLAAFSNSSVPLPVDDDKPVELTVVDLSATPPPVKPNPAYIETNKDSAEEPKEKTFESNANSIAAAKIPAAGDLPLPSQEGKDRPHLEMENQEMTLPNEAKQAAPPPQPTPPPQPSVIPTAAPTPKPKPSVAPTATPPPSTPTPPPLTTPEPEQLAMLTATPPPPLPLRDEDVEATPPPEVGPTVPPITSRPQPQTPPSTFQPEKQQTRITGRITDRGSSSVNAVGTPLGRYQKLVSDAIGSRWYYYTKSKMDLVAVGTAVVEAEVDPNGKIQGLRLISNNSNEAFANVCLQSFQEAQIPPIPPDLVGTLPDGRLQVTFSFTMYAN